MPRVVKSIQAPFSAQNMYELVNDIEAYPQFLPWCKQAIVHTRGGDNLKATLTLGKGPIVQHITTSNTMIENKSITMQYQAGPFKECLGNWLFMDMGSDKGCEVRFDMQYEYQSILHAMTLEPIFNPIANQLIEAFYKRAKELFGEKNSG